MNFQGVLQWEGNVPLSSEVELEDFCKQSGHYLLLNDIFLYDIEFGTGT